MSLSPLEINLKLSDEKVKFSCASATSLQSPITFDYPSPLGNGEGYLGLEVLVMSFAGCVSTAIVAILRRMGKQISSYDMHVLGIRKEMPLMLEKIQFEIIVDSPDATDEDLEKAIRRAEEISPVWLAVKNNVEVEWTYRFENPNIGYIPS